MQCSRLAKVHILNGDKKIKDRREILKEFIKFIKWVGTSIKDHDFHSEWDQYGSSSKWKETDFGLLYTEACGGNNFILFAEELKKYEGMLGAIRGIYYRKQKIGFVGISVIVEFVKIHMKCEYPNNDEIEDFDWESVVKELEEGDQRVFDMFLEGIKKYKSEDSTSK